VFALTAVVDQFDHRFRLFYITSVAHNFNKRNRGYQIRSRVLRFKFNNPEGMSTEVTSVDKTHIMYIGHFLELIFNSFVVLTHT
jgi:hypothetical protein